MRNKINHKTDIDRQCELMSECSSQLTLAILRLFAQQIKLTLLQQHYYNGNSVVPICAPLPLVEFRQICRQSMNPFKLHHIFSIFFLYSLNECHCIYLLTVFFVVLTFIVAMEKFTVKQLNANNGEYKLEQQIYDQNIDNILQ